MQSLWAENLTSIFFFPLLFFFFLDLGISRRYSIPGSASIYRCDFDEQCILSFILTRFYPLPLGPTGEDSGHEDSPKPSTTRRQLRTRQQGDSLTSNRPTAFLFSSLNLLSSSLKFGRKRHLIKLVRLQ